MQRKLDVALGLVHRPRVLFLDEPTTGLDPEARADMWAEIARLAGDEGLTVLLTTHYLEEADRLPTSSRSSTTAGSSPRAPRTQLKGELRGDAVAGRAGRRDRRRRAARRSAGVPGVARASSMDGTTLRARVDDGAAARARRAGRAGAAGVAVTVGDRRPAVAGRRLPAIHRPQPSRGGGGMSDRDEQLDSGDATAP